jgi:uncharacterized protein YdaU (DUF1376 family)
VHYYKRNLGDYAKKAGKLSMLQHGSYTLLIDACYDRERFPTLEDAIDWTWASTTAEIEAVQFVLRKFFTLVDGVYVQERIAEEIAEYHKKAETNKRIAIERETQRKEKSTVRAPSVNEAPPNQEPITINQEPALKPKAPAAPLPVWLQPTAWDDFKSHRKAIKATLTPRAETLAINELEKLRRDGHDPTEVIQQSILRGWKGLFALNTQTQTKGQPRHEYLSDKIADLTGRNKRPASNQEFIHGTAKRVD